MPLPFSSQLYHCMSLCLFFLRRHATEVESLREGVSRGAKMPRRPKESRLALSAAELSAVIAFAVGRVQEYVRVSPPMVCE